jgi:tetratricopeptide (TPR) repeat protein
LVTGFLFAVHPVHVEAVAWISSLPDLACATLYLAGVLVFLASSQTNTRVATLHVIGALAFLACALFKEPGMTLPIVVALWDLSHRQPRRPGFFWTTRYGGLALAATVYLALRLNAIHGFVPHASQSRFGPMRAMDVAGTALWRYLCLLVWPFPLNVFRTMEDATGLPSWMALIGLPLLVGLAWWRRDARATVGLGLLLFSVLPALYAPALLPGLDNPWAERYVYLSSAGFAIVVAGAGNLLGRWLPAMRLPLIAALGVVILAFGLATVERNRVWKSDLTLWSDAVRRSPRAGAARSYLGWALFSGGEVDRAIEQYRVAIALNPNLPDAHHNLAVALASKGLHEAALPSYLEAIRLKPKDALSRANLSLSLTRLGRPEAAYAEALRAVELDPGSARAHGALGIALGEAGHIREAAESFRRAIALDPSDTQSRANLATADRLLSTGPRTP